jgi:very-short-patch-repair endonuclease
LTHQSHCLAAVYACGPEAVLSHRAAGALWEILRGIQAIEVTAPRSRTARDGILVHRSRRLDDEDRDLIDAIPVTSVARTLVDLADVLPEKRLADAVHEAEVRRLFDLTRLTSALSSVPGRKGRHKLRRVLAAYAEPLHFTRSRAERLVIQMCKGHGLDRPQVNVWVGGYEVDFYWPEADLVLEVDGEAFHRTTRGFHEDRRRDRALAAQGIHVVRATWRDLTEGEADLALELRRIWAVRRRR